MKTLLLSATTLCSLPFGLSAQSDWSDAPAGYGAAEHDYSANPGYLLGTRVDAEFAPFISADALGDDNAGVDDEDGILPKSDPAKAIIPWQRGAWTRVQVNVTLPVAVTEAKLDVWIDWNLNGAFAPVEQVLDDYRVHAGTNLIPLQVPLTALPGLTAARFRLTRRTRTASRQRACSGRGSPTSRAIPFSRRCTARRRKI